MAVGFPAVWQQELGWGNLSEEEERPVEGALYQETNKQPDRLRSCSHQDQHLGKEEILKTSDCAEPFSHIEN